MNLKAKYWSLTLFLLSLVGSASWAGRDVGNGGDAAVCRSASGRITSVHSLDRVEGQKLRNRDVALDAKAGTDPWAQASAIVARSILVLGQERSTRYLDQIASFVAEAKFISGVIFRDIPDSIEPLLPAGCVLEQLVIQSEPEFPGDPRYLVNQDLWAQLALEDQVAVVLHEIIYREAFVLGHNDSRRVRAFSSWLYSGDYFTSDETTQLAVFKQMNFPTMRLGGLDIDLLERLPNGRSTWIAPEDLSKPFELKTSVLNNYVFGPLKLKLAAGSHKFYSASKPKELCIIEGTWNLNGTIINLSTGAYSNCAWLQLDPAGKVSSAPVGKNTLAFTNFRGEVLRGTLKFNPPFAYDRLSAIISTELGAFEILEGTTWQPFAQDANVTARWHDNSSIEFLEFSTTKGQSLEYSSCKWSCDVFEFHENGHIRTCKSLGQNAKYECGSQSVSANEIQQDEKGVLSKLIEASLWVEGPGLSRQRASAREVEMSPAGKPMTMKEGTIKVTVPIQGKSVELDLLATEAKFAPSGGLAKVRLTRSVFVPIEVTGFGLQQYHCNHTIEFDAAGVLSKATCFSGVNTWTKILLYPATHPDAIVLSARKEGTGPTRKFQDKSNYNFFCYCDNAFVYKDGKTVCDKASGIGATGEAHIDGCASFPGGGFALRPSSARTRHWPTFEKADGSRVRVQKGNWAIFDPQGFLTQEQSEL